MIEMNFCYEDCNRDHKSFTVFNTNYNVILQTLLFNQISSFVTICLFQFCLYFDHLLSILSLFRLVPLHASKRGVYSWSTLTYNFTLWTFYLLIPPIYLSSSTSCVDFVQRHGWVQSLHDDYCSQLHARLDRELVIGESAKSQLKSWHFFFRKLINEHNKTAEHKCRENKNITWLPGNGNLLSRCVRRLCEYVNNVNERFFPVMPCISFSWVTLSHNFV